MFVSIVEVDQSSLEEWATERLEAEITLVAAHLAAGEWRWLELVAEFDRREAWASCGNGCGWARRLEELPKVAAAFSVGELSYSKVRAVTRVATTANENLLVNLARCMTRKRL